MTDPVILSLRITKTSFNKETGVCRWFAQASSTDWDLDDQRMSIELYKSFIDKIEKNAPIPVSMRLKNWEGGMPYLSVSHFATERAVVGYSEKIYIDGKFLKATGTFTNNDIGNRAYMAVSKSSVDKSERNPIRISISFLDYGHVHEKNGGTYSLKKDGPRCPICKEHGDQGITFVDGQIIHLALTRIPANQNTNIVANGVEKMGKTVSAAQKMDAASIVGDDFAAELELEEVTKTHEDTEQPAVVVKTEEDIPEGEEVEKAEDPAAQGAAESMTAESETQDKACASDGDKKKKKTDDEEMDESEEDEEEVDEEDEKKKKKSMLSPFDEAVSKFTTVVVAKYDSKEAHTAAVNQAYVELNQDIEAFVDKQHEAEPESVPDSTTAGLDIVAFEAKMDERFKSFETAVLEQMGKLAEKISSLNGDVNATKALEKAPETKTVAVEQAPEPLNKQSRLQPPALQPQQKSQQSISIARRIANKSVGLPENA